MAPSKTALDTATNVDLLTAINRIESAGKPVNVALHVRDASSESFGKESKGPIHAIAFAVEADGTYSGIIKTVQLLESLPLPITVEQYDLSLTPVANSGGVPSRTPWHISIRVRLLTTSNIIS